MKKIFMFIFLLGTLFTFPAAGGASEPEEVQKVILRIISAIAGQGQGTASETGQHMEPYGSRKLEPLARKPSSVSALPTYFPLNNNDIKYYETYIYGTYYNMTMSYTQVSYNGRTCYLEKDFSDGSMVYYGYNGDGLYMYGVSIENESYPLNNPMKVANENIVNNGGSLQSSTTLEVTGYNITLIVDVTINLIGSVTIPIGTAENCRSVDMTFTYIVQGTTESMEVKEAWILAPDIGKMKIAVYDQFMSRLGWATITGGTVGGKSVSGILNPLEVNFQADPLNGLAPLSVLFTDLSTGEISDWLWDFGDGTTASGRNPTHIYSTPGYYTVSLSISGAGGSDSKTKAGCIHVGQPGADLNNDNKIDLSDAILALQIPVNFPPISGPTMDNDINGDNKFGLEEAVYIFQYASELR